MTHKPLVSALTLPWAFRFKSATPTVHFEAPQISDFEDENEFIISHHQSAFLLGSVSSGKHPPVGILDFTLTSPYTGIKATYLPTLSNQSFLLFLVQATHLSCELFNSSQLLSQPPVLTLQWTLWICLLNISALIFSIPSRRFQQSGALYAIPGKGEVTDHEEAGPHSLLLLTSMVRGSIWLSGAVVEGVQCPVSSHRSVKKVDPWHLLC